MVTPTRPGRGGFIRPFGAAIFIRDFLAGQGPTYGVGSIDPSRGAPQTDVHAAYKNALHRAIAEDLAVRRETEAAKQGGRAVSPEEIERLTQFYLERIPYKLSRMRYHSFVTYFRNLKALGFVEATGETEPSALQDFYPPAPPRTYYRLTGEGRAAEEVQLSDPIVTLYQYDRDKRSPKVRKYVRPPPPRGYAQRRARELATPFAPSAPPPPPGTPHPKVREEVPESVQARWDALLERIRRWSTPRPANAERLLRRFVEETRVAPPNGALDRLEVYRAHRP